MQDSVNRGPLFSEARQGATLQIPPPFSFNGVTCRVFPVRANMSRLTRFCDRFINNGIPKDIVYFRPAMPMVFMQVIHYGSMSVDTQNFGWFSQNEFVFSVPVERYEMVRGRPEFKGFGLINPFIFVDKETSEIIGREVYGWPKVHGWLSKETSSWIKDPTADRNLASFDTMVYGETYLNRAQKARNLISIFEKAPTSLSKFPPDANSLMNPLVGGPRTVANFTETLQLMWQNLANLSTGTATAWINDFPVKGLKPMWNTFQDWRKFQSLIPKFLPVSEDRSYSLITLKQFRDARDPRFACYQAVIDSQMYLNQFNSGGMLGDNRIALGDPTGGYYIKLRQYPSQPIAQSLGLEAVAQTRDKNGIITSTFEPVLPFWLNVDISYNRGDVICSQTMWSKWERGNNPTHKKQFSKNLHDADPASASQTLSVEDLQDSHLYNTSRGEALEEVTGPFSFPNATVRVLPLLADASVLQKYVDENMNIAGQKYQVMGDAVYMIITNYDEMSSATNNIGRWANREVRFSIPVRWYNCTDKNKKAEFVSVALLSPFVYCDRDTALNTMREIYGVPAFKASIECPTGSWLDVGGPTCGADRMDVYTDVLPALFVGSEMQRRKLITVTSNDVLDEFDYDGWNHIASHWGKEIVKDLEAKQRRAKKHPDALRSGKALALSLLTGGDPFNQVTLKQFRDVHDIEKACYQAVVNTQTTINHVWDLQAIEEMMHVSIYDYPTQPIVRMLGLKVKCQSSKGDSLESVLEPQRPFWMKVSMTTGEAENVAVRAGSKVWRLNSSWFKRRYFNEDGPCPVGPELADKIDDVTRNARAGTSESSENKGTVDTVSAVWKNFFKTRGPNQYLNIAVKEWQRSVKETGKALLSRKEVADFLRNNKKVTPQMIIESILSHEWSHWGNPRSYRRLIKNEDVFQLPDFIVRRDSVGTQAEAMFPNKKSIETGKGGWYPKPDRETNS